jgi:hypothetical protein
VFPAKTRADLPGKVLQEERDEIFVLELILMSPAPPPSDATNYLGGVADVLEDKKRRGDLAHLGELADFTLYGNDRQFHEVRYQWE